MASPAHTTRSIAPATSANDNVRSQPCTWTAIIRALRTVGPEAEMCAWRGRKTGLTPDQFVEQAFIAWGAV